MLILSREHRRAAHVLHTLGDHHRLFVLLLVCARVQCREADGRVDDGGARVVVHRIIPGTELAKRWVRLVMTTIVQWRRLKLMK